MLHVQSGFDSSICNYSFKGYGPDASSMVIPAVRGMLIVHVCLLKTLPSISTGTFVDLISSEHFVVADPTVITGQDITGYNITHILSQYELLYSTQ